MLSITNKTIIVCIAGLALLLITTNPDNLPSWLLIVPFLIIFVAFFLFIKSSFQKMGRDGSKSLGLVMLLASFPVVLLAMQSLGQLTIRDFAMILALFVLTYFYVYRSSRSRSS